MGSISKRRISWLATTMAAAFVIAACGGGSTGGATTAPSAAASAADPNALPKPELTKIRIGISTPNEPVQFAEKLADYLGIYKKYGITTVEITGFEGDG